MTPAEFVAERVRQVVSEAPPLAPEVIDELRALLAPLPGDRALADIPERVA